MSDEGKTLGQYELLRKIGSGGMAEVYLAKQRGLVGFEKLVVIKQILPHLAQADEFVKMFLDEARTAADLRHPNIVQILEVGEENGQYYIVMEFLHGQNIRRLMRQQIGAGRGVPMQHALQMIIDAASGLYYAHGKSDIRGRSLGIVHRDVSPQNIIVTYDGSTKIVDFGIAKAATQTVKTKTGVIKGKYSYMSPEQASVSPLDHRSDQFALGIIAYEMTLSKRLFKYPNEMMTLHAVIECKITPPTDVMQGYPQELSDIIMKSLAPDREDRYQDIAAFAAALEEFLASQSIVHSPARVGGYMKDLFADVMEQEDQLGHPVLPDEGSEPSDLSRAATRTEAVRRRSAQDGTRVPRTSPGAAKAGGGVSKTALIGAAVAAVVLLLGAAVIYFVATAKSTVGLLVQSKPPGASIFVDGKLQKRKTPSVVPELEVGNIYTVRLELSGHEAYQVQVRVNKKQGGKVDALLKREQSFATVHFSSKPEGAKVEINGAPVQQRTPFDFPRMLVGDELEVTFSKDGYRETTRKYVVKDGGGKLHVRLRKDS